MHPRTRLIIYGIINFLNISVFITLWTCQNQWKLVFYMTILSFWTNSFYFLSTFIFDLKTYFLKKPHSIFLSFMRDHFFKYSLSFSLLVVIVYYTLAVLGPSFLKLQTDFFGWVMALYLHGAMLSFKLLDLKLLDHSFIPTFKKDLLVLMVIYACYVILSIIALYGAKVTSYQFMEFATAPQLIIAFLIIFLILINCYFIFQLLLRKKLNIVFEEKSFMCIDDSEGLMKESLSISSSITTSFTREMIKAQI